MVNAFWMGDILLVDENRERIKTWEDVVTKNMLNKVD